MIKSVHCDFDFQKFINADYKNSAVSTYMDQKRRGLYFDHPNTYNDTNTIIHYLHWNKHKNKDFYIEIGKLLDLDLITVTTICQCPGNTVPWHLDGNKDNKWVRVVIFLEDWKLGHFYNAITGFILTGVLVTE